MEATGGRSPMTVVDLFSGAGGMSAGFHTHPDLFRIVGAADIEVGKPGLGKSPGTVTYCNRTYAADIGEEPLNGRSGVGPASDLRQAFGCSGKSRMSRSLARRVRASHRRMRTITSWMILGTISWSAWDRCPEVPSGIHCHGKREGTTHREPASPLPISPHVTGRARLSPLDRCPRSVTLWPCPATNTRPDPRQAQRLCRSVSMEHAAILNGQSCHGHLPPVAAGKQHPDDDMHVSPRVGERVLARMQAIPRDAGLGRTS